MGVDEKSIAKGHKYESLVYDIDAGTVEFVWDERGRESLENYYRQFSREELSGIQAVANGSCGSVHRGHPKACCRMQRRRLSLTAFT